MRLNARLKPRAANRNHETIKYAFMQKRFKKRIRLKGFDYKGCYRYFITICTNNKETLFVNSSLIASIIDTLLDKSKTFGFKIWAYCFMPDHLHLLVEGIELESDMKKFISSFKQSTGFNYKKQSGQQLWQANYYEHVLRKEEDTHRIVDYIFANPVRKAMVEDYRFYGLLGSFEFDVNKM